MVSVLQFTSVGTSLPNEFGRLCWQKWVAAAAVRDEVDFSGLDGVFLPGGADIERFSAG